MSHFGNQLRELLASRKRADPASKQADFAHTLGISPSMLSRFLSGDPDCGISSKTLARMRHGLADPREQADLLAAFLQDCLTGPGAERLRITGLPADDTTPETALRVAEEEPAFTTRESLDQLAATLDDRTRAALLTLLRAGLESRELRRHLRHLAALTTALKKR